MRTLSQHKVEAARALWKNRNHGALSRLARELNLTPQFVAEVFRGTRTSKNRQVEHRLAELGCPGFTLEQPATPSHSEG